MNKIFYFILFYLTIYSFQINLRNSKIFNISELNEEEKSDDIIILHTNDVHCGITDNIGYDGLMLYKKELQRKYKYVLTVDAGDHIQGDIIGLLSKGIDIIKIMNKIGYDVSTIGNHEFDFGVEALNNCSKLLECGYINSNFCYRKNKDPVFDPYKIVTLGNIKLGFIGVITPLTLTKTYLHSITDDDGKMLYDFLDGNNGQEMYDEVQKNINKLKNEEKVDYIIILDHLGDESETPTIYTSSELLSRISGINAMLDGHTHKVYNKTGKDKEGKNIILAQTGTKLSHIGVIKIKTNGEIISEMIDSVPEPIEKEGAELITRNNKEIWVDTEMKNFLINIEKSHSDDLDEVIGVSDFSFIINTDPTKDHHKHTCRSEECTLGNLIADSMREIGNGDIAIKNSGSIRTDLQKGNITFKDILNILPYSSEIVVKEVLGKDILDALELGVRFLPEKSPKFPQVSGIKFHVNIYNSSSVQVDSHEMFINVTGNRRVSNVKVNGKKLNLEKKYKIVLDNFIADGGDGYSMFGKYEDYITTSNVDNEVLMKYIKNNLGKVIPKNYAQTEGRINIYSSPSNIEEDEERQKQKNNNESKVSLITFVSLGISILFIIIVVIMIFLMRNKKEISSDFSTSLVQDRLY